MDVLPQGAHVSLSATDAKSADSSESRHAKNRYTTLKPLAMKSLTPLCPAWSNKNTQTYTDSQPYGEIPWNSLRMRCQQLTFEGRRLFMTSSSDIQTPGQQLQQFHWRERTHRHFLWARKLFTLDLFGQAVCTWCQGCVCVQTCGVSGLGGHEKTNRWTKWTLHVQFPKINNQKNPKDFFSQQVQNKRDMKNGGHPMGTCYPSTVHFKVNNTHFSDTLMLMFLLDDLAQNLMMIWKLFQSLVKTPSLMWTNIRFSLNLFLQLELQTWRT